MSIQAEDRDWIADCDAIEAHAFKDWHRACAREIRLEHSFQCLTINHGCAISLPTASGAVFNRIFGLSRLEELDEAYQWMRAKPGPKFLQLNPQVDTGVISPWLEARGFIEHGLPWAKLVCGPPEDNPLPAHGVRSRKVRSPEAAEFGAILCHSFGLPEALIPVWASIVGKQGWSCSFALVDGKPIGAGAMYAIGDRGWLGAGAVLPAFRNRGAHKALIEARLVAGRAAGVRQFVVEACFQLSGTTNTSYDNLRKTGFMHAYTRRNFAFRED
ncbi:MAG: GNAT family N-acetyltransferase [Rhizobium sp.]|nr:GNAT family N-acetyltransferase [Rhizobium sp.]